ncbi:MAG: EamA family transporter [Bacteroidetes bacterium]|jgi:drug/metabolite transporter (DMT)-like permease|nr:EamA family transporter [Bacteroidota bacterium]MBK6818622.1 EamA family transporter [Bacteroidota bacterium]MBK7586976.1 EamA family transporter [Bacteroidota bacterium]MBK8330362.1 EamA family transporter [Bacteroidota bacterium]
MKNALIKMHLAVFLWGFTGVLGRAITLQEYPLVWYRTMITATIFVIILFYRKEFIKITGRELLRFMGIGTIIAIHWVAFYGSIKYANASIALTCLATAGIFTAILEPIVLKVKFNVKELIIGFIALIGMYSIYHFEVQYAFGIMLGIFASILSAVFTILNKKIIHKYPSRLVAFYEIGSGFLFLTLLLPVYLYLQPNVSFVPIHYDWIWLLILSLCCTVWGQSLALSALKKLSSFTTVLMVNLEPVYGILLAMLIYHENKDLGIGFYLGILLIAFSVALHTLMMYIEKKRERKMIA